MKKIPTLFVRDPENMSRVTDQVTPGCEWVLAGEGVATAKWDGTSCMVDDDGVLWRRREVKDDEPIPDGFMAVGRFHGRTQGWIRCWRDIKADRHHYEAYDAHDEGLVPAPGTYELVGPKVQGNPHAFDSHELRRHGDVRLSAHDKASILDALSRSPFEGIVWHHEDGRMAKIKRRDFGLPWPAGLRGG